MNILSSSELKPASKKKTKKKLIKKLKFYLTSVNNYNLSFTL